MTFEKALISFTQYSTQPGRRYIALETDRPDRWENFATSHPEHKPTTTETPSAKES